MLPPLSVGQEVGKYVLVRLLGQGGMGMVFEAQHRQLGTCAALKVLWTERGLTAELVARFLTEARAAAHIDHPGVVKVFEYDQLADGTPYLVMEFLRGRTLAERLEQAAKTPGKRIGLSGLGILAQLASTLADIHKRGIVHRDLKPGNIMLVPDPAVPGRERVKILDFGIAKVLNAEAVGLAALAVRTRTGSMLGTPQFMSPEQWAGVEVDDKTDCYALGVIAYQVLVGRLAFDADNQMALMFKHASSEPTPLDQIDPSLPTRLVSLVGRMLLKDKHARPRMTEVAGELSAILSGLAAASAAGAAPIFTATPDATTLRPEIPATADVAHPVRQTRAVTRERAPSESLLGALAVGQAMPSGNLDESINPLPAARASKARWQLAGGVALVALCVSAGWFLGRQEARPLPARASASPGSPTGMQPAPQQLQPPVLGREPGVLPTPQAEPMTSPAATVSGPPAKPRRLQGLPPLRSSLDAPVYPAPRPAPAARAPQPYVPPTVD